MEENKITDYQSLMYNLHSFRKIASKKSTRDIVESVVRLLTRNALSQDEFRVDIVFHVNEIIENYENHNIMTPKSRKVLEGLIILFDCNFALEA